MPTANPSTSTYLNSFAELNQNYQSSGELSETSSDDGTGQNTYSGAEEFPSFEENGATLELGGYQRVIVVTHHLPMVCQLSATSKLPPARAEREKEREKERERYFAGSGNISSNWDYNARSGHDSKYAKTSVIDRSLIHGTSLENPIDIPPLGSSPYSTPTPSSPGVILSRSPQFSELNGHMISNGSSPSVNMAYTRSQNSATTALAAHEIQKDHTYKSNGTNVSSLSAGLNGSTKSAKRSDKIEWNFKARRGHSALYAGVRSLVSKAPVLHIGWTDSVLDDEKEPIETNQLGEEFTEDLTKVLSETKNCVPVFLDDKIAAKHYEGYCKAELWPLFHYVLWDSASNSQLDESNWLAYQAVNQKFAEVIAQQYKPGDLIWINDYHLLLVPSLVRKLVPEAVIGVFLHTPFPTSEIFRCLPKRKEILEGVLGANLVGFQTYSYARHFSSSCTRILGLESSPKGVDYGGSLVEVAIFPIGIDINRVVAYRNSKAVKEKAKTIRDLYAGKKIIVGRDKLDHIKGVQHKLNAFEKFLETYPEWQNKVVLIQVSTPAQRGDSRLETRISELVSRINGTYGSLEFTPVHHYHQHLDAEEYFALLSVADCGLITSLRDGMNTTSHEFVVCQEGNWGPLILSEFTGTAGSLSSATLVNPWDYLGVANAIHEALSMTKEERQQKHQQQFDHVSTHTANFWASSFIKELVVVGQSPAILNTTPVLDEALALNTYAKAKKRLLMFDYDGTLTPIVKTPMEAVPPPKMLEALSVLVSDPDNYVFIISGRDQETLELWLGHIPGLGLSAEHGSFIKYPENGKWINLTEEMDFSWKNEVNEIFTYYTERTQGSFVEHKRCSITWHYRLADPEYGTFQANECRNHLENAVLSKLPVEVLLGKKNLEVRPHSINKGEIVKRLVAPRIADIEFALCVGDDRTDEDMFAGLKASGLSKSHYFNCTLGSATKKTQASWHVAEPKDVIAFMAKCAEESKKRMGL
ncbi:threalose-6-phosphate phosphatase [Nowakowskiella sp. JEL0407]|nr:threalose-6-phosphate phosphatase [Nowakowskiella sp. JEL0407]